MKRILLITVIALLAIASANAAPKRVSVVPAPVSVTESEGEFVFNESTVYISCGFDVVESHFQNALLKGAGLKIKKAAKASKTGNVVKFLKVKGMAKEEYRLDVTSSEIVVSATEPNGAFYALQTLLQLLPQQIYSSDHDGQNIQWSAPCCEISDKPRFRWRGMHIDVSLHFFDIDYIKRYIDLMTVQKMNIFHWHLTDDQGWRIEIKKYPELTRKGAWRKETVIGSLKSGVYDGIPHGGFYTQDQIREVVKYAADRYMTIIPEIEMPGHAMAALACYPQLSCRPDTTYEVQTRWGIFRHVYCPKDETFAFLEDVLTEVMELFPSEIIHIGGDECPKKNWKVCSHCQQLIADLGLKDEFELQSYFIQRIEKFVNSRGRKIIGWDEILQGGLAPNAIVMSWLGEEGGIKAAQQHHQAVMCPHTKYYLDYWQADPDTEPLAMGHLVPLQEVYAYNPVPKVLTAEESKYIMGVQGCVWTEYLPTPARVEYMAWPRSCAIAEAGWTPQTQRKWNDFSQRLEKHFGRLDEMKVQYCKAFWDVLIRLTPDTPYSQIVHMSVDAPGAEIHYTTDGTTPTVDSPAYTFPFVINRVAQVKAQAFHDGLPIGKVTSKQFNYQLLK